jgi:prefoldin subunit 4
MIQLWNRYRIGEAFVHLPLEKAQVRLAADQERVQAELSRLQDALDACKSAMQDLKVHLYSKFGNSINLD